MRSVAIIGGGIVGTSIAYHLRDADCDVTLFEKGELGAGTTAKSAAMLTHHQEAPDRDAYEFREHAWEWYDEKIDDGTLSFDRIGTLHLARSDAEYAAIRELQQSFASFGLDLEILSPDEIADHGIDPDGLRGGLWFPDDGVLDPGGIVQFFAGTARRAGVEIETNVEVTGVATAEGAVTGVETAGGFHAADVVVNAAGPWAPTVNDLLGVDAPLRHTEGPILVLKGDDPVSLPFVFFEEGVYFRGEGRSQVFAGKLATDYGESETVDPDYALSIGDSMYDLVASTAGAYLERLLEFDVINEWNGLRTVTPDGRCIVDETDVDGYILACGMSGYGVTVAPAVGEFTAEWLTSGRKPEPLESLALDRFEAVAE
ncbi:NAD(P)/FAD-dependent oxidoreductase [Halobellus ruber]|uniref:FAD-binding oxidoreductase n=1 Tax=Halobellus ruber TaxID=2761102 RepID=A0A7J9SIR1_9EURY|nr:FAD-dependent oxidoreductase [Halobellus ruber]MBB6645906.1 FAD-binding oxidoreductase [Halobellus ruber]